MTRPAAKLLKKSVAVGGSLLLRVTDRARGSIRARSSTVIDGVGVKAGVLTHEEPRGHPGRLSFPRARTG